MCVSPDAAAGRLSEPLSPIYKHMKLNASQCHNYLKRLGLPTDMTSQPPTMAGLATLVRAHVARIPYENIDIHKDAPLSALEPVEAAVERLTHDRRGGYCFHLAPPFCALLNSMGFNAHIYRGQVINHPGLDEPANPNHAVVMVSHLADAPTDLVLADVGIGDGPRNPVPMRPGAFHEPPFVYGIEPLAEERWRFVHDTRGGFVHFDVDASSPAAVSEFALPHQQLSTLPESHFVRNFTVQRVDDGIIEKIVNRSFRTLCRAGSTATLIESEEHLDGLLKRTFGLDLDAADRGAVWRSILARESART